MVLQIHTKNGITPQITLPENSNRTNTYIQYRERTADIPWRNNEEGGLGKEETRNNMKENNEI